jgi:hypothetical protein
VHLPNLTGVELLRSVPSPEKLPLCVLTSSRADEEVFKREFGIEGLRYLHQARHARELARLPSIH